MAFIAITFLLYNIIYRQPKEAGTQRAIMMPIRGYSPDLPYQLFSTFGPIPGLFRSKSVCFFWQTPIQWRLGSIPGLHDWSSNCLPIERSSQNNNKTIL